MFHTARHDATTTRSKPGPWKPQTWIWMFPKIVVPPNHPFWYGFPLFSPSILVVFPYFWKHPSRFSIPKKTGFPWFCWKLGRSDRKHRHIRHQHHRLVGRQLWSLVAPTKLGRWWFDVMFTAWGCVDPELFIIWCDSMWFAQILATSQDLPPNGSRGTP